MRDVAGLGVVLEDARGFDAVETREVRAEQDQIEVAVDGAVDGADTIGSLFEKLINVIINPKTALLVLPAGAALIALHYALHALTDALYLAAGQIPPEEEGPAAH